MTTLTALIVMAAEDNHIDAAEVTSSMTSDAVTARHQVCWVLHRSGWTYSAIGRALGRDHTTVINAVERAQRRLWMFGVHVAPESVRAGGPLVGTNGGEAVTSPDMATVAVSGNDLEQGPGATTGPDNCIEDETSTATTRTTCVDCGEPPMPGGLVRCEPCLLSDLDRRVRAKRKPVPHTARESRAVRQVRSPSFFSRGAA